MDYRTTMKGNSVKKNPGDSVSFSSTKLKPVGSSKSGKMTK